MLSLSILTKAQINYVEYVCQKLHCTAPIQQERRQMACLNILEIAPDSHGVKPHARIQEFSSGGGGGVQASLTKKDPTTFFFLVVSLEKSNGQFQRNLSFSRFQRGSNIFQGGPTFTRGGGGSNCLFLIEIHITCDFPGGVRTPCPPSGSALEATHIREKWCVMRYHSFCTYI